MTFLLLAGCGGKGAGQAKGGVGANVLTFSWNKDIGDLNPHLYLPSQMFAQAMVYEPLVKYAHGGKSEPCLAESWSVSPDGSDINAPAAKKNFDAVLANAKRHEWLELINQIGGTEAVDEHTFKITFKNPYYPALQELSLFRPLRFLAPSAFPDSGNTAEGIKKPVGTGPWVLKPAHEGGDRPENRRGAGEHR